MPSDDHIYNQDANLTFEDFEIEVEENSFGIKKYMKNFQRTSADVERMFSLGRISKNFLQNRLLGENHSRNVFLDKKKSVVLLQYVYIYYTFTS